VFRIEGIGTRSLGRSKLSTISGSSAHEEEEEVLCPEDSLNS
jgi:hypothetical protein